MTKKFLILGNRGGFYHVLSQRDTYEEAIALAHGSAATYGGPVQFTYLVAEVKETFKSKQSYTRKRSK